MTAPISASPEIISRAAWGACRARREPELGTVALAVVHHTALGRLDGLGEDPHGALRAIQELHMGGNGWDDVGYHLLVDRCGLIYEGRGGGVDRPLVGAHALGYNRCSAAVALIGDFSAEEPTRAALAGLATALALKLRPHGLVADANTIRGHRELAATECPGAALEACLPAVRGRTAELLA